MQSKKNHFIFPVIFALIQVFILSTGYLIGRMGFGAFDMDVYKSTGFICLVLFEILTVTSNKADLSRILATTETFFSNDPDFKFMFPE